MVPHSSSPAPEQIQPAIQRLSTSAFLLPVFTATIFLSALLLFSVQPMFAKMVLPRLGGAPAVWSVAMVFFQAALLAGYAYAHLLSRLETAHALAIHLAIMALALLTMPISVLSLFGDAPPQSFTALWLIAAFTVSVGLPFFAVAANGPLLQSWFSRTDHQHAPDPYFLYAASNLGSFAALIAYPLLMEPLAGVRSQTMSWTLAFCLLLLAVLVSGFAAIHAPAPTPAASAPAASSTIDNRRKLAWIGLAFIPSALLVAVTHHLSTDVAAAPFLWVLPLALFLLTFVITFQRRPILPARPMRLAGVFLGPLVLFTVVTGLSLPLLIAVPLHLAAFFVAAMVCHAALVDLRPPPDRLTSFYLFMSLGGVLGGIFAALIAPLIFNTVTEYPLMLGAAATVAVGCRFDPATLRRDLLAPALVVAGFLIGWAAGLLPSPQSPSLAWLVAVPILWAATMLQRPHPQRFVLMLIVSALVVAWCADRSNGTVAFRSFFGIHKVNLVKGGQFRVLVHGTTIHGAERIATSDGSPLAGRPEPLTYYWTGSPLADGLDAVRSARGGSLPTVYAIGLGTGSLACQSRPGESWTYFEIDPRVVEIARDRSLFRFLAECGRDMPILLGDARLTLAGQPAGQASLIIVDAFSSDAIPVHLMTREALDLYLSRLDSHGVVLFHVTNRHMELATVVAAIAEANGLVAYVRHGSPNDRERAELKASSSAVAVARNARDLGAITDDPGWKPLAGDKPAAWSDDFSNVLSAIWRRYSSAAAPPSASAATP